MSKIKHLLHKDYDLEKVYARKCVVKEIDSETAIAFGRRNNISEPSTSAELYIGCFSDKILVGVMFFTEKSQGKWEITSFCTDNAKLCVGVCGKMFSYFKKRYTPIEVESFANRRWVYKNDNVYTKMGFTLDSTCDIDFEYVKGDNKRYKKHEIKNKLNTTKYYPIWDCGQLKYVWRKQK